tara:strand:- start:368 stop:1030 length:663 start_codon:yes stop_codon:yes gene_type:complete
MIKHLIFDFDGVIIDSELLAARAFLKNLSRKNINYKLHHFAEKYSGNKMVSVTEELSKIHDIGDKKKFLNSVMKTISNLFEEQLKPVKGIKNLLENNCLDRYIGSNSGKKRIMNGLDKVGLSQLFDEKKIYTFEMVKYPKPKPDVFLKIINDNNLKKKEVLVLEDSVVGASAAISANLKVLGITAGEHWDNRKDESLVKLGCIKTINTFNNFEDILRKIS